MTSHSQNSHSGNAMQLHQFLSADHLLCHIEPRTPQDAVALLVQNLSKNCPQLEPRSIVNAVLEREAVMPTVIAPGIAMPHARLDHLEQLLIAVATSREGIDFGSEFPPVHVMVLVLSPGNQPGSHLQVMSALAREFKQPERIMELAQLERPSEMLAFFGQSDAELPSYLLVSDLLGAEYHTLLEQDTLHCAIRKFAATRADQMAVLDDDGDLRGIVRLEDILRYSLPEHVMWLEDLSPIYHFQPFADMLANAHETKIADLMQEEFITVSEAVPAVQLAKLFLTHHLREIPVVNSAGKLTGVIRLKDFCAKLFWE